MVKKNSYQSKYVTIGIPCYNHQFFIEFCLDSLNLQSYLYKKILIIDDGSIDESISVIERWIRNNPEVDIRLIKRENRGLNYTLNEIIKNCNTEYLCLMASDDALYSSDSISERVKVLIQNSNKLAVIGDAKVINEKNDIIYQSAIENLYKGRKTYYHTDEGLRYSIINDFSIPGPVLLVKRELYDIVGLYPNLFAEDIYFYLRVIGMGLLVFLDKPVALYRVHSNNTGGNSKYAKQINNTFLYSYFRNIKYYKGKLKFQIFKKVVVQIYIKILLAFKLY
jgi:glycosyltransferase involved in cell wall biosynthesis